MARGQSQGLSQSVRSEFGEPKATLSKGATKLASEITIPMIQPLADGSAGIDAERIIGIIEELNFKNAFTTRSKESKELDRLEEQGIEKVPRAEIASPKQLGEASGIITDILELNYLKSAKAFTLSEAESNGETTPALTRTVNGRYDPKITELESSIEDGYKQIDKKTVEVVRTALMYINENVEQDRIGNDRDTGGMTGKVIGAYKQGDVKKLFNDIYDTLNS